MHHVRCTHCGQSVQISPDAPRCSICGQDLHTLIPEGYTAPYFYNRAADLAARGDLPSALAEAERGLDHIESSELRLLAAILAKRLNDMDAVRAHVAAIPVDDRLRQEAEWLLRSHPAARPAIVEVLPMEEPRARMVAVSAPHKATSASPLEGTTLAAADAQPTAPVATPSTAAAKGSEGARATAWAQRLWGAVALIMIIIAGAMGWTLLSGGPDALMALLPGLSTPSPSVVSQSEPRLEAVTPLPLVLPTPTPQGAQPAAQPLEVAPPTVPADFVRAGTPEAVAGNGIAAAAGLSPATLDLPALLINAGRADLAAAGLRAAIDGNNVRVSGVLTSTADRQMIVDMLDAIPAVQEINTIDLLVRIPATYTVQAGDSTWRIVSKFYGVDPAYYTQLVEANPEALGGNATLQVGDVLKLPPLN